MDEKINDNELIDNEKIADARNEWQGNNYFMIFKQNFRRKE